MAADWEITGSVSRTQWTLSFRLDGVVVKAAAIPFANEAAAKKLAGEVVDAAISQELLAADVDAEEVTTTLFRAIQERAAAEIENAAAIKEDKLRQVEARRSKDMIPESLGEEIPAGQVVRPERQVIDNGETVVSGVTMPWLARRTVSDKRLGGRDGDDDVVDDTDKDPDRRHRNEKNRREVLVRTWASYTIDSQTGGRKVQILPVAFEVAGKAYHVDPWPSTTKVRGESWSMQSRKSWLSRGDELLSPKEVFYRLDEMLQRHVVLPDGQDGTAQQYRDLLACWVLMTYITPVFDSVPYLRLTGTLESGKTRLMSVLCAAVFRPTFTASMSPAVLFRRLDGYGGTLFVDEAERLQTVDGSELVPLLNAGYRSDGVAMRCEGDDHEIREFAVYGPKCFGSIADIPEALASRSITIPMLRADNKSPVPNRDPRSSEYADEQQELRDSLHILALNYGPVWAGFRSAGVTMPPASGRQRELWRPILLIAEWLETHHVDGLMDRLHDLIARQTGKLREVTVPDTDMAVLQAAVTVFERHEGAAAEHTITAQDIFQAVVAENPAAKSTLPMKRVSGILDRYGLPVRADSPKRFRYRLLTRQALRDIEGRYGVVLLTGADGSEDGPQEAAEQVSETVAESTPEIPSDERVDWGDIG